MHKFVETTLVVLVIVMAAAAAITDPTTCLALVAKLVLGLAALAFLAWAWGWRRPRVRCRVGRLARAVKAAAGQRVHVLSIHWVGSPARPESLLIRVLVRRDADEDTLIVGNFDSEFRRLVTLLELPDVHLKIDSEETIAREFGGNRWLYDRDW